MRVITRFMSVLIASALMLGAGEAFAQSPIKIGFISPISGAIAQAGKVQWVPPPTGARYSGLRISVSSKAAPASRSGSTTVPPIGEDD